MAHTEPAALLDGFRRAARPGLITDMDGTISHVVPIPTMARPTDRSRELLATLAEKLALVAVISGRGAGDLRQRVSLPQLVYVGNHGLERWSNGGVVIDPLVEPHLPLLRRAHDLIAPLVPEGGFLEDKTATLSLHYRGVADPEQTARELRPQLEQITAAEGLRLFPGRMIFEVRPELDLNKGTAFRQLVQENELDAAIYIGDDITDVDAMLAARDLREQGGCYGLAVGVAADETPQAVYEAADWMVQGVAGVEELLAALVD